MNGLERLALAVIILLLTVISFTCTEILGELRNGEVIIIQPATPNEAPALTATVVL